MSKKTNKLKCRVKMLESQLASERRRFNDLMRSVTRLTIESDRGSIKCKGAMRSITREVGQTHLTFTPIVDKHLVAI